MNKNVALRMPFRVLRHIDQHLDLRKQLIDGLERVQPAQSDRRLARPQQQFFHLSPNSFSGKIGKIYRAAQLDGVWVNAKLETRGKLRGPQDAQAVFRKRIERNCAQNPALNVFAAVEWINDRAGQRILHNRVDGEVATARRIVDCHRGIAFNDKGAMATTGLSLAARQRNIKVCSQFINRERFADDVDRSDLIKQRAQFVGLNSVSFDVPILRLLAHEQITDTTADEQCTPALDTDRLRKIDNLFWELRHSSPMSNVQCPNVNNRGTLIFGLEPSATVVSGSARAGASPLPY